MPWSYDIAPSYPGRPIAYGQPRPVRPQAVPAPAPMARQQPTVPKATSPSTATAQIVKLPAPDAIGIILPESDTIELPAPEVLGIDLR